MRTFALSIALLLSTTVAANEVVPIVERAQFVKDRSWTWIYSKHDSATDKWHPYYRETYTVVDVQVAEVTIEMSSHELPNDASSEPHHKFIVDLKNCDGDAGQLWKRGWTVRFFTKSLGSGWTLVSNAHPNLVFTEKFSCFQPRANQQIEIRNHGWNGSTQPVFARRLGVNEEVTWFFHDHPQLKGVMVQKNFSAKEYRSDLAPQ